MAGCPEESKGVGYRYFRNTGFVGLRLSVDLQREVFCSFLFIYLVMAVLDVHCCKDFLWLHQAGATL